jgi:hypothetical protein
MAIGAAFSAPGGQQAMNARPSPFVPPFRSDEQRDVSPAPCIWRMRSHALAANATATLTIVVKTTAPGSVDVINTATVTAVTNDPNSANDSATLVTRVSGQ